MANLDLTQTPAPVSVDTPSIITSLDTNTGPQASPVSFGPNLNGLAQGLDQASDIMSQTQRQAQYSQKQLQYAKNEAWALKQHSDLAATWTKNLNDAAIAGQPLDPEKFRSDYYSQAEDMAANAPNPMAQIAFMAKASQSGEEFFKQNLGAIAQKNLMDAKAGATGAMNDVVGQVGSGLMSPNDGVAALHSIGTAVAPAVPGVETAVAAGTSQIIQAGLQRTAQTQGPTVAALATRGGFGGDAIPDVPRETLATQYDNAAAINQEARRGIADQTMGNLLHQAASTGAVSMVDQHAAVTEQAAAHTAEVPNTGAPDLVSVVQAAQAKYGALESQVSGRFPEIQLAGLKSLAAMESSKLIEQRLNIMAPDQQRQQLAQMQDAFGGLDASDPLSGLLRHATTMVNGNANLLSSLTPDGKQNPSYDPVTVANRNPTVVTGMSNALQAIQAAKGNPAALGLAQGQLSTALQTSFAAQRLAGVPAGKELVLSRQQAEQYAGALNSPEDYKNVYGQITSTYGGPVRSDGTSASAVALQQVFNKKGIVPGSIQLAALNPNLDANWAAASFVPPSNVDATVKKSIDQEISDNSGFNDFFKANQSDPRMATQRVAWTQGAAQMIAYRMQQYSESPKDAAAAVYQNTVGAKYNVIDADSGNKLAIPKDFAPTAADATTLQNKANVALTQLQQAGAEIGQADNTPLDSGMRWQQATKNGYWVYDDGAKAMIRYQSGPMGDAPFLLSDGRPLGFSLDGLRGSNIVTPKIQTAPLLTESLGDVLMGKTPRAVSYQNGPQKLDSDLNSLIPAAPSDVLPYFPVKAPRSSGQPSPSPSPIPAGPPGSNDVPQAWQSGATTTHYAYHDDNTPDKNSKNGIGSFGDNPLTPGAAALSPSLEKKMNAVPGDVIEMKDDQGNIERRYFGDRTSQKLKNDRIDLYDPHGSEDEGTPFNAVSYRNLGGGKAGIGGRQLSALGESNLAGLEASGG